MGLFTDILTKNKVTVLHDRYNYLHWHHYFEASAKIDRYILIDTAVSFKCAYKIGLTDGTTATSFADDTKVQRGVNSANKVNKKYHNDKF